MTQILPVAALLWIQSAAPSPASDALWSSTLDVAPEHASLPGSVLLDTDDADPRRPSLSASAAQLDKPDRGSMARLPWTQRQVSINYTEKENRNGRIRSPRQHRSLVRNRRRGQFHYPGDDELMGIGSPFGAHFGLRRLGIHHIRLLPGRRTSRTRTPSVRRRSSSTSWPESLRLAAENCSSCTQVMA